MDEFLSDMKTWFSDMKENPEIIGSELANVGGKIGRGLAAVIGGTVEAGGAVGAAAVDITASGVGGGEMEAEAEFLSCGSVRTGNVISVAANDKKALCSEDIAARAEAELKRCAGKRGEYGLFSNNCHAFTRYCITGERSIEGVFGEAEIEAALESVFKTPVVWIPMGRA